MISGFSVQHVAVLVGMTVIAGCVASVATPSDPAGAGAGAGAKEDDGTARAAAQGLCGEPGQACCAGGACNRGLACSARGYCMNPSPSWVAGSPGSVCAPDGRVPAVKCNSGLTCYQGMCVNRPVDGCGDRGNACCVDDGSGATCADGLICHVDTCREAVTRCGTPGLRCCEGNCSAGSCLPSGYCEGPAPFWVRGMAGSACMDNTYVGGTTPTPRCDTGLECIQDRCVYTAP